MEAHSDVGRRYRIDLSGDKERNGTGVVIAYGIRSDIGKYTFSGAIGESGIIESLFRVGIEASEAMPLILFIGIGAMIDFGPLIANPKLMFFGAAAQFGIFLTIILASFFPQFSFADAAAIGIIGAADGPTSILVANTLRSNYLGAIMVVAYSYMALVPIIQPFAIKMVTTKRNVRSGWNINRIP